MEVEVLCSLSRLEFLGKVFQEGIELYGFRSRLFLARQLQDVFHDAVHALGLIEDDIGQPHVVQRDGGRFIQNWAAWVRAASGLRISCAMLPDSSK
jgi:hypothetical protein